jgi:hypothetical protein
MMPGRPSKYRPKLADKVCQGLVEGKSLREICRQEGMPARSTIVTWLALHPEFKSKYDLARQSQADLMDDMILETANKCTEQDYQSARVRINAYQWRASRLQPKQYGDRINLDTNIQVTKIIIHDELPVLDAETIPALPAPDFDDPKPELSEPELPEQSRSPCLPA